MILFSFLSATTLIALSERKTSRRQWKFPRRTTFPAVNSQITTRLINAPISEKEESNERGLSSTSKKISKCRVPKLTNARKARLPISSRLASLITRQEFKKNVSTASSIENPDINRKKNME